MATSRILLISNAPSTGVADALRASGHDVVAAATVEEALASGTGTANAEVIVLDLVGAVADSIAVCGLARASADIGSLPILSITDSQDIEDRIELLEANADDVIGRPFDPRELDARVEALAVRLRRSRELNPSDHEETSIRDGSQRRVIAVFSPKGGAGTTTIAVNVATWLASQVADSTVIIDLDTQFGQVATHLNVTPRQTIHQVAEDEAILHEPGLFTAALERHSSGLKVLGGSTQLTSTELAESTVKTLLTTASAAFQFVVVDAGSSIDTGTETALTQATDLIVVLTPEFPAIKAVHALGELLANDAQGTAEVSYVLNEIFARELLRLPDIEEALGTKVALTIPYDAFAFLKSVNEGVPVVLGAPKSPAAQQLGRFAARLAGMSTANTTLERKSKGLAGLFGRG
ncbi:MAG: AAA family ATPase [Chloroflexota bacterium]